MGAWGSGRFDLRGGLSLSFPPVISEASGDIRVSSRQFGRMVSS